MASHDFCQMPDCPVCNEEDRASALYQKQRDLKFAIDYLKKMRQTSDVKSVLVRLEAQKAELKS